jgi:hypothetical protein
MAQQHASVTKTLVLVPVTLSDQNDENDETPYHATSGSVAVQAATLAQLVHLQRPITT